MDTFYLLFPYLGDPGSGLVGTSLLGSNSERHFTLLEAILFEEDALKTLFLAR